MVVILLLSASVRLVQARSIGFSGSRSRWLKEGDANTSYFHASVNGRCRKNSIFALRVGDRWVESVSEVRAQIVDYFRIHFSESMDNRPTLDGIEFQGVDPIEVATLTAPFTITEIEEVVMSSDGDKSPGPDAFNFAFLKSYWGLLKDEVRVLFAQFFVMANLPRSFSSYFITLIPKIQSPLSNGRQLVDGVVAVNEIIDLAKKGRKDCLIFKVDFEKAYDSVSWNFLDYMMMRFGFGDKWRGWIKVCVFSGNLYVLVNGCPTEEINIQRGLKQGDPLAPFLFLLVVEGLSGAIRSAEEKNLYTGFKSLKAILRSFELASGLRVNFSKSSIMGVNVSTEFLGVAERFLHCRVGSIPFTYLGLPIGASHRKDATWQPLLDSLARRLGVWRNKYVSLGGRVVLLNSVLNSIPIFYLSFMKLPIKIWKKIVQIQRNFLWGGPKSARKLAWVSWAKVCKLKSGGGLGVRDLRALNLALVGKWRWRLISGGVGLWRDIIFARYGPLSPSPHLGGRPQGLRRASGWWRNMSLLGGPVDASSDWFSEGVTKTVGNGLMTSFWFDPWVGETPLRIQFQRLFQVSAQSTNSVGEMGRWVDGQWITNLWCKRFLVLEARS
ncbi:hypothetical protein TSUD_399540 [Trifolium subterraneum]|uniref:Reverse transcriptase domain-containing protein n=1 Tax=Trifolium subterraneum TaxID=3900 RepID=A0A2Z6NJZ5_TRISU|nr:hypothetical protein TSUD_399540 [Trifolium subterraneum]